jgi:diacylglycerol kinase (ATP)
VPIGVLPFGTGNDLAAMLGWGRSPPRSLVGKHMKNLQKLVKQWSIAEKTPMDLWQIEVEVHPGGHFLEISNRNSVSSKTPVLDEHGEKIKIYRRLMSNYFSFGIDARIGLNFEKKRSHSKWINKIIYCWEGFKKIAIC